MTKKNLIRLTTFSVIFTVVLPAMLVAGGRQEQAENSRETEDRSGSTRIELGESVNEPSDPPDTANAETDKDALDGSEERPIWALIDHPMDDQAVRNISGVIDDGYVPVGMDIGNSHISVLYASSTDIVFDRWIIHEFTKLENLNNEFSGFLLDGWIPMDISRTPDGLSVLFVRGDGQQEILGWRIQEISAGDPDAVLQTLERYRDNGFLPYGVTIDREDDEFWFLLLQTEQPVDTELRRIALNGFTNENIQEGISTDIQNQLLPWGLARGNEGSFVLYLF